MKIYHGIIKYKNPAATGFDYKITKFAFIKKIKSGL